MAYEEIQTQEEEINKASNGFPLENLFVCCFRTLDRVVGSYGCCLRNY